MGLQPADTTHLLCNHARAPPWLPPYARFNIVALTHNMMFTDARAHRSNLGCRFCLHPSDSTSHVFGNCPAVLTAITSIYNQLNLATPPSNYFNHLVCAEPNVLPHVTALRTMLANAIWRARTETGHGKDSSNWCNWMVEDIVSQGSASLTPIISTPITLATLFICATSSPTRLTLAVLRAPLFRKLQPEKLLRHTSSVCPLTLYIFLLMALRDQTPALRARGLLSTTRIIIASIFMPTALQ